MTVPPKPVRRLVILPVILLGSAVVIAGAPLLLAIAAACSPIFGRRRPLRVMWLLLEYAIRATAVAGACFGLWLASGFGLALRLRPFERAHYDLLRWFLVGVHDTAVQVARLRIEADDCAAEEKGLSDCHRPVLVFSRHAGAGDSFLIVHLLLSRWSRLPRVVMLATLQLDPLLDIIGNRLPNLFVDPQAGAGGGEVAKLAGGLDRRGAFLIFPEGGNFTKGRRERAIERLEQAGRSEHAERARGMKNVLAPRPGGAIAAIDACPGADVVFLAHVGFPTSPGDFWRRLPFEQPIELKLWQVPVEEIPREHEARVDWLYDWWERVDAWIESRRRAGRVLRGTA